MVQELYKKIGEKGSYLICLYDVANDYNGSNDLKYFYRFPTAHEVINFIDNGWLSSDMFVKNPEGILSYLTGVNWNVEKRKFIPGDNKKHYIIKCYSYKKLTSFCLDNFNPLDDFNYINKGVCNSLRVCTPLNSKKI